MLKCLERHFTPCPDNNRKAHKMRIWGRKCVLIFIMTALLLSPALLPVNIAHAAVIPSTLAQLTNIERQSGNLPSLAVNPVLNASAQAKANDMAAKGYFAHNSPDGKTPWYWISQAGYHYEYAGENLAVNFTESKDVTVGWMNSPTHRENIMKANYTEVGTGVATGMYEGKEAVFVVQVYASPLVAPTIKTAYPKTSAQVKTKTISTKKVKPPVKKENIVAKQTAKPKIIAKVAPKKESAKVLSAEVAQGSPQTIPPSPAEKITTAKNVATNTTNLFLAAMLGLATTFFLILRPKFIFIK
jgi:hypothetical protein